MVLSLFIPIMLAIMIVIIGFEQIKALDLIEVIVSHIINYLINIQCIVLDCMCYYLLN